MAIRGAATTLLIWYEINIAMVNIIGLLIEHVNVINWIPTNAVVFFQKLSQKINGRVTL